MSGWRRSLGPRLLVTFVAVALLGIAVLALLVALGYGRDVRNLAADERQRAADVIADAAADAYQEAGGWEEADLGAVSAQAATKLSGNGARAPVRCLLGPGWRRGGDGVRRDRRWRRRHRTGL